MSTPIGRAAAFAAALSLSLTLAACGGKGAEENQAAAVQTDSTRDETAAMTIPPEPLTDGSNEPIPVTLEPVNESGVEGRATQIQVNDSVRMSVMVQGLPKDGDYA